MVVGFAVVVVRREVVVVEGTLVDVCAAVEVVAGEEVLVVAGAQVVDQ